MKFKLHLDDLEENALSNLIDIYIAKDKDMDGNFQTIINFIEYQMNLSYQLGLDKKGVL